MRCLSYLYIKMKIYIKKLEIKNGYIDIDLETEEGNKNIENIYITYIEHNEIWGGELEK